MLIKYIKSVLWRVAIRLSYTKVKWLVFLTRIHCVLCKVETNVLCIILMNVNVQGCAMGHRVSHQPLAAEVQAQSQVSPREIYGRETSRGRGLSPDTLALP